MIRKYVPIIKTGDAELRALSNIDDAVKNFVMPLFEITRGRKTRNAEEGVIAKKVEFISNHFSEIPFILDLTSDKTLTNSEINQLHSSNNNYERWTQFCIKNKDIFGKFYPVIQIEEEDDYENYLCKLFEQVKILVQHFDFIVFRSQNEIEAKDLITDIKGLLDKDAFNSINLHEKLIYVLDYKYIKDVDKCANTAKIFIGALDTLGIKNIVLSSTSFPSNVSEHMSETDYAKFEIKEFDFFNIVKSRLNPLNVNLIYSDYASINPIRNDNIFARGWIPRIDVPSVDKNIHCMRQRREKTENYAKAYADIAQKVAKQTYFTDLFDSDITSWGNAEIQNASRGNVGGAIPSFWISVRMNIYFKLVSLKLFDYIS